MGQPVAVVTGAAGFIGTHLSKALEARGYTVRRIDIRTGDDLRNPVVAHTSVEDAEVVFHLAADMGGVAYFHTHDYRPYFNNARMTMNVLDACEIERVPLAFFASSACAYPTEGQTLLYDRSPEPFAHTLAEDELEQGEPDQMYGREKLMMLRLAERAPFDARVGILHTVYGPGQDTEGERVKFPPALARKVLEARKTGTVEVWGDGQQQRSYLYISDAIDRILTLTFGDYQGPTNIGYEGAITCDELATACLDARQIEAKIVHTDDGPTGVQARDCSNAKWNKVYGPSSLVPPVEGMGMMLDWLEG